MVRWFPESECLGWYGYERPRPGRTPSRHGGVACLQGRQRPAIRRVLAGPARQGVAVPVSGFLLSCTFAESWRPSASSPAWEWRVAIHRVRRPLNAWFLRPGRDLLLATATVSPFGAPAAEAATQLSSSSAHRRKRPPGGIPGAVPHAQNHRGPTSTCRPSPACNSVSPANRPVQAQLSCKSVVVSVGLGILGRHPAAPWSSAPLFRVGPIGQGSPVRGGAGDSGMGGGCIRVAGLVRLRRPSLSSGPGGERGSSRRCRARGPVWA